MNRKSLFIVVLVVMISTSQLFAGAFNNWAVSIGGGYSNYSMKELDNSDGLTSEIFVSDGFTINCEILYIINTKQSIGAGFTFLNGSRNINSDYLLFLEERYQLHNSDMASESVMYYYNPHILVKQEFDFIFLNPYIKAGLGYTYGNLNVSVGLNEYQFKTSGCDLTLSVGSSLKIYNYSSLNLEIGYRHLKTSNLQYSGPNHSNYKAYFSNYPLDFSGLFLQTCISFNL